MHNLREKLIKPVKKVHMKFDTQFMVESDINFRVTNCRVIFKRVLKNTKTWNLKIKVIKWDTSEVQEFNFACHTNMNERDIKINLGCTMFGTILRKGDSVVISGRSDYKDIVPHCIDFNF